MFDEKSIVDRILNGDDSAFERLVDRYEHKVYQYALRFLGQESDACAAVEKIFYQIYSKLSSCTDAQLSTWVFRIAANVCADHQHHKRGAKGVKFSDAMFHFRDPFHKEEHDLNEEIQLQLLRLTRQQREVLLLRDLCGLSDEETAAVLGLEGSSVRPRLSRARKNLRDQLLRQNALEQPGGAKGQRSSCGRDSQRYRELCSRYVDECISDEDKSDLLDHIQVCGPCAAYLNDLTVIGRSLSHMEEEPPPEELRQKIITTAQQQAESIQSSRRRESHRPIIAIVGAAAVFLILISSGVLGGLFVNSTHAVPRQDNSHAGRQDEITPVLDKAVNVPDAVAANSYAFVIAAEGDTDLPELSTSATLLAGDAGDGVEYYTVDNDINLVQKLTEGLESVGYETEAVNNNQLVISSNAPQGLFIVIHREE